MITDRINRVVNLRFKCCGLNFDAAIDCDWALHFYEENIEERRIKTPVELYCFDKPEWDIKVVYYHEESQITNEQQEGESVGILNTCCSMEFIKREARKWVKEMKKGD